MFYKSLALCATMMVGAAAQAETVHFSWTPGSGMTPGPVASAEATFATNSDGISMHLASSNLTPGNVVTVWFVAIQNPAGCSTTPCIPPDGMGKADVMNTVATLAGGTVVEADGTITMNGFMPVGEVYGNFFDTKLETPEIAEVHLAIQDHGPLNADRAAEMMTSYRDGCTDASVPPFYPETARSSGMVGSYGCKVLQFAVLLQN